MTASKTPRHRNSSNSSFSACLLKQREWEWEREREHDLLLSFSHFLVLAPFKQEKVADKVKLLSQHENLSPLPVYFAHLWNFGGPKFRERTLASEAPICISTCISSSANYSHVCQATLISQTHLAALR